MISIRILDSLKNDWHEYINKTEGALFSHQLGWKEVIDNTFGHKSFYLIACKDSKVVGILPLFLIKSKLFGKSLSTSPFLTHGGILADNEKIAYTLTEKAIKIAKENNVDYLELKNDFEYDFLTETKDKYFTYILDLSKGIDSIWKNDIKMNAKRNIKKAQKTKLHIVKDKKHLNEFVNINFKNMRRLGTPAHSLKFFENIFKFFPDSILLTVKEGDTVIGGMILVKFKDKIEMPWVATLHGKSHLRPANFLYWEAIKLSCKLGMHYFDFGRSKEDSGTAHFKEQHGAKPVQIYYQDYLNKAKKTPDFDAENSKFKPLIYIWRKIPLPIEKRIGPRLIKYIP